MTERRSTEPVSGSGYAGDLNSKEAWERLASDPAGQLLDVRTEAEWNFVGVPDLGPLRRQAVLCEWQRFPPAPNPGFVQEAAEALAGMGYAKGAPLFFLCRSGARSRLAALTHAIVPSTFDADVTRLTVAVALGGGIGLAVGAARHLRPPVTAPDGPIGVGG